MSTIASMTGNQAASMPERARVRVACTHCGLDVPLGLIEDGASAQFCCSGCKTAYEVIHSCGLDRYYRLRDETSERGPEAVKATGRKYAEFDDAVFESLYVRTISPTENGASDEHPAGAAVGNLKSVELMLSGVHCAACVWLVEKLANVVPGVIESRLDLRRSLVKVTWDPGAVSLSRIARMLDSLGYPAHPARGAKARDARRQEDRRHMVRLGVAGACAANVMLVAIALYAGAFDGMERSYEQLFRWVSLGISAVSLLWPGAVFFRSAWAAIRTRSLHLDLPIAIGLAAGGIWGTVNTIRGEGEIYFDSLAVLVFVLLIGRYIQHRQQRWASDSVEMLFMLTPSSARRVREGAIEEVPIEAIASGELVEVLAGDSIPVDGVIESGESDLDESLLTGESRPVRAGIGAKASAGAVNLAAPIRVRVEATGEQTRVGRLMKLVSDASQRRAPIVRLADTLAGWFVVGSLSLAAITLVLWLWLDASKAIDHAAALLIVTCPCAVGLATPLAMTIAIGRAARHGILIKGGEALERLASPGPMFLDKTGTLTHGRLSVSEWIGDEAAKPLAAALERNSTHPIASAIARLVPPDDALRVEAVEQVIGKGIAGFVNDDRVVIGSLDFVQNARDRSVLAMRGSIESSVIEAFVQRCAKRLLSPVVVSVNGTIVACAGVGDSLRASTPGAVASLAVEGWGLELLSGDHQAVVTAAGAELGIRAEACHGGASPEAKLARVQDATRGTARTVVMIGDGVNDAAALSAATVGIAVHGGAEASLAAADIYLNTPGLESVASLTHAARATMRTIRLALAASIVYNAIAAGLAMTGYLHPVIAAILMPISSLTVLTLALRSKTFATAIGRRSTRGAGVAGTVARDGRRRVVCP